MLYVRTHASTIEFRFFFFFPILRNFLEQKLYFPFVSCSIPSYISPIAVLHVRTCHNIDFGRFSMQTPCIPAPSDRADDIHHHRYYNMGWYQSHYSWRPYTFWAITSSYFDILIKKNKALNIFLSYIYLYACLCTSQFLGPVLPSLPSSLLLENWFLYHSCPTNLLTGLKIKFSDC